MKQDERDVVNILRKDDIDTHPWYDSHDKKTL